MDIIKYYLLPNSTVLKLCNQKEISWMYIHGELTFGLLYIHILVYNITV